MTQRSAWLTVPITFGLFFGGGIGGVALAESIAPGSLLGPFIGLLTLPLAFIIGMQLWLGFALISALGHGLRRLFGKPLPRPRPSLIEHEVPPGGYAFVLIAMLNSTVAGVVMGLLASRTGFFTTLLIYLITGLSYGLTCWLLARQGFLPFPEE